MAKKQYYVLTVVDNGKKKYEIGSGIKLEEADAGPLLACGSITDKKPVGLAKKDVKSSSGNVGDPSQGDDESHELAGDLGNSEEGHGAGNDDEEGDDSLINIASAAGQLGLDSSNQSG